MVIPKNKKAMLANLIGGFITILIAVSLIPVIAQEVFNVTNCNITNNSSEQPLGATDSFGGGGADVAGQFGGYDGKVKKSWVAEMALYQTNQSFTGLCIDENSPSRTLLNLIPAFFALAVCGMGIMIAFSALRDSGMC